MTGSPSRLTIARRIGEVTEKCAYGCEHVVTYVDQVHVHLTDRTSPVKVHSEAGADETLQMPVYKDTLGRHYTAIPADDYYARPRWLRDDGVVLSGTHPSGAVRRRDGTSIAECPDGPAWATRITTAVASQALRDLGADPTKERVDALIDIIGGEPASTDAEPDRPHHQEIAPQESP